MTRDSLFLKVRRLFSSDGATTQFMLGLQSKNHLILERPSETFKNHTLI